MKPAVINFLDDLAKAQRPAILVGGGARGAALEIEQFGCEHLIPVFRTWNALDIVTDDSPIYAGTVGTYGGPGRNYGIANCDLLLVAGCRLSGRITGGMPESFARGAKKYIVDVDEALLDPKLQQVKGDVNVLMRCEDFMASAHGTQDKFPDWLARCREWVTKYDPVTPAMMKGLHHYGVVRKFSEWLPSNAIVVYDTGGSSIMMGACFRSKKGQRIFGSNGNSPMSFALSGAIGAWFAEPERPVYCVIGDGGFQQNIQELQSIKHYDCDIRVLLINNEILGNTKSFQRANSMKEIACGPDGYSCPDFYHVVRAYGIDCSDFRSHLSGMEAMLKTRGPWVANVLHPDFCDYQPKMVRWDRALEEMEPDLPIDEHLSNMFIEPWKRRG